MRRFLLAATAIAAMFVGAHAADAQVKISGLSQEPGSTIPLTDMFAAQSTNCPNFGDCKVSMQQILSTVLANTTSSQGVTNTNPPLFSSDYGLFTSQIGSITGGTIYSYAIGTCGPTCSAADALRGVATMNSGVTVASVNGVAGYVYNKNGKTASDNGKNAVGLFSVVVPGTNNTSNWGINVNIEDTDSPGTDRYTGTNIYNEFDFNVHDRSTTVNGLILQGVSTATPAVANGFVVGNLNLAYQVGQGGSPVPWSAGFVTEDSAAVYALQVGLRGTTGGVNVESQYIGFATTDPSGNKNYVLLYGGGGGQLATTTPAFVPANDDAAAIGGPNNRWAEVWTEKVVLQPLTVSTLPSCNFYTSGALATVTDSKSTTTYTNVQGGGNFHALVMCDSIEWVVH